ncbi:helix-turn-helix transcriptional regulator [Agrococcus jejuensis]|uniref:Proteasome accessory factor B n=1 Tax=Agrococcus jejuensis TaxID=399736 RepID=A0A1G8H6M8_9MICO|nr:WYL domain-containing protein [Agrococcus jejuensis]SDI02209.1 proteasome accessory factor B [Agrococcus jejuensis]
MSDVSVSERQFSLTLALLHAAHGATKRELFERVAGYQGRPIDAALERQFERDKDDLREQGFVIDVFTPPAEHDNNQESRYRLLDAVVGTPEDLAFSESERTLIDLALRVWRDGGLTEESQLATTKLRAHPQYRAGLAHAVSPTQSAVDRAFQALKRATERGAVVQFAYLKPGEREAMRRTVQPWCVLLFRSRWMLHGFDVDRGETRTFLMRRIVSDVQASRPREPFAVPDGAADAALEDLERIWASATARVRVLPGSDAEVRLARRRDTTVEGDELTLHHADTNLLADELAGYGAEVVVLHPPLLAELVRERLERIRDAHADLAGSDREGVA